MISKIKKLLKNKLVQQIIKFGIVGGTSFILDYAIFTIFSQLLNIHYLIASILSFSIAVIYNYVLSFKYNRTRVKFLNYVCLC